MALTETYVDPSIAANSGTGTIGDPYGDLQYALNTVTRNATDGDRFNIKAGTAEILTGSLSLTTYGTPAFSAPLIFQGYTTSQGDGGQGAIDCQANSVMASTHYVSWYDMELYDGPATGAIIALAGKGHLVNCYIHDSDGYGATMEAEYGRVVGCRFEDLGGASYPMLQSDYREQLIAFNYFKQGAARTCKAAIFVDAGGGQVLNNIVSVDSSSNGISIDSFACTVLGNTVLSASGTGKGIDFSTYASACVALTCINNYIEGFSGTGGIGLNQTTSGAGGGVYGQNAFYNNTTNEVQSGEQFLELGDNETLSASGLAKSGADTFANRFTYFAPVDTGNMQTGGYPEA